MVVLEAPCSCCMVHLSLFCPLPSICTCVQRRFRRLLPMYPHPILPHPPGSMTTWCMGICCPRRLKTVRLRPRVALALVPTRPRLARTPRLARRDRLGMAVW
jgi:hypothetical protein